MKISKSMSKKYPKTCFWMSVYNVVRENALTNLKKGQYN